MKASCPGPENASECSSRSCRYGGCQGRLPEPRRDEPRELLPDIATIAAVVLGIAGALD